MSVFDDYSEEELDAMNDEDLLELAAEEQVRREEKTQMIEDFGQSRVTVKKAELLATLKKNRDEHRGLFLSAQEGFKRRIVDELESMLKDARDGKKIRKAITLADPVDQTKDYDRVIRMLEMSIAEEVTISERQFAQFVMDEWDWKEKATMTNMGYSVGAGR